MKPVTVLLSVGLVTAWIASAANGVEPDGGPIPLSDVSGKRLLRVGRELVSGLLGAPSIAQADLPAKVRTWQQTGFDGLVFTVAAHSGAEEPERVHGSWWGVAPLNYEHFVPEIEAFQSVKDWGRLTDNFLWSSTAVWGPGACQDWFNAAHWDVLLANVRLQARIARECGFKGILLDTEQYDQHGRGPWYYPFNYKHYAKKGYRLAAEEQPHSYAECVARVRERATQYAQTITDEFPELTLFVIDGLYDHTWRSGIGNGVTRLIDADDSLYPAFVDGLLVGLDEQATLVAATETTYGDSQYKDMLVARDATKQSIALSMVPELARKRITFSVGIWTDCGWGTDRFSDTDVRVNQRDPQRHKHAVHNALAASDRYAWTYGEISRFLTTEPTPLIREYWQATVDGHRPQNLDWSPVPRWDMTDYAELDADMAVNDAAFWNAAAKEDWTVATALPLYWHFLLDHEQRLRLNNWMSSHYNHEAWSLISTLKCWQSQSIKANGIGIYKIRFDAPASLDATKQDIVLAFGGFSPGAPKPETGLFSWMDVSLNGKGYPMRDMIDVSESIRPGESNHVAVRIINMSGPGGLMGHVKLLTRNRASTAGANETGDGQDAAN